MHNMNPPTYLGHGGAEVVAGDGLPVVPGEVQVHALCGFVIGVGDGGGYIMYIFINSCPVIGYGVGVGGLLRDVLVGG